VQSLKAQNKLFKTHPIYFEMAVLVVENLILNPTRFNSGVFDNHEEDFPLQVQSSKERSSLSRM
jgi:hypothetical protein